MKNVETSLKKAIQQLSQKGLVHDLYNKNAWYYPAKYSHPHIHVQNQYLGTDSFSLVSDGKCINQKLFVSRINSINPQSKESIDVIRVLIRTYQLLFQKLPNCKHLKFYESKEYPDFQKIFKEQQQIYNTKKAKYIQRVIAQKALEKLQKDKQFGQIAQGALTYIKKVNHQGFVPQQAVNEVTRKLKYVEIAQDGYYTQYAFQLAMQFLQKDRLRFIKICDKFYKGK